ncbi:P-loop NTPase fold protein [Pseudovibrio sp. JE062]|uniref:P-loop NTPase fold protein n=1 Tax=Pseudovibrio sp. JE062 TaxID=439495 RepID=UPI000565CC38|nr:P-loop NTPase fold protein [Pseudovibrio sp. JE062]
MTEQKDGTTAPRSTGVAILLHAPWGKGKTSLWKLLQKRLEDGPLKYMFNGEEVEGEKWITIEFNAWEHEHREKPWWPFL